MKFSACFTASKYFMLFIDCNIKNNKNNVLIPPYNINFAGAAEGSLSKLSFVKKLLPMKPINKKLIHLY